MAKNFYSIKEVAELLEVSHTTAHRRIKAMNDEMKAEGYYIEQGKVPVQLFHEKYPYIEKLQYQIACSNSLVGN